MKGGRRVFVTIVMRSEGQDISLGMLNCFFWKELNWFMGKLWSEDN